MKIWSAIICLCIASIACGQTVNQNKLEALLAEAEATNSDAIVIYKDNQLLAEKYFANGSPDSKIESMSVTKSVVGLAVAAMLSDGLIDNLDIPVSKYYPIWNGSEKEKITLAHLVHMTSGIQNVPNVAAEIYPSRDFIQLALDARLVSKPGEMFSYNNKASNLLAGVIQKITGKRLDIYINDRLFKPLDIKSYEWSFDRAGNPYGMTGCQIKALDYAKIGLLVLNNGRFNGKQIIAEKYIAQMLAPSPRAKWYGMLWWLDHEQIISVVDEEIINAMEKANLPKDFMEKARKMKGVYHSAGNNFSDKAFSVFGPQPWDYINQILSPHNLQLRKTEYSGKITYRASGYLGNYIIVDPKTKIVAVRLVSVQSHQGQKDNFSNFPMMATSLVE